ncbi:hypothetical protein [Pseudomonas viridiflava]|uniref:hypothetical protein n=1 Tax=Pseudomonas viridiflava TaxID=33069 RepID=UPI0018E65C9A|nr:hypothetical protein [Pseudomonas viridiflava]MBI6703054.1 hypothetical protein [Pseudomonas viridiflava]MBI6722078.1 hypothetical protein [Pseudomonas viridiflava]
MSRTKQLAAAVFSTCAVATSVCAQDVADIFGKGSWLQLSSKNMLHGTQGKARVVVCDGNHQTSLDAPYEVVRIGEEGGDYQAQNELRPYVIHFHCTHPR